MSLFFIFLFFSALSFILFGVDKFLAVHDLYRIPEKVLLASCFCLGALGGFLGMFCFHHKTRKLTFRILVPAFLFLQIFGVYWLFIS